MAQSSANQNSENLELRVAGCLCLVSSLALLTLVLVRCGYGLDLTDEGFYLTWISYPEIYSRSATQFGYVLKPLYALLDYDLVALRRVTVLVTWCLATVVFWQVLREFVLSLSLKAVFAVALASSTLLMLFHMWLPTPSYNWLNLHGLMISLLGLLLVFGGGGLRRSAVGGMLVGVGGVLVALSKPSSALALAILCIGLLLAEWRRRQWVALVAASAAGLSGAFGLLLAAWAIDGSFVVFIERVLGGARWGYTLNSEFKVLRWDRFKAPAGWIAFISVILLISAGYAAWCFQSTFFGRIGRAAALSAVTVCAITIMAMPDVAAFKIDLHYAYVVPAVGIGLAFMAFLFYQRVAGLRLMLLPLIALLALPFVHAIGTTKNLWLQPSQAFVFWVAASVVVISYTPQPYSGRVLAALSVATVAVTSILLMASMEYPYRQTVPLRVQSFPIAVDARSSRELYVDREVAKFVEDLRSASNGNMHELIDLSGRHPAAAFLGGATAPGTPWLLGGYRNSVEFLHAALSSVPCETIAKSWLLVAPPGTRKTLPISVIKSYGMDLERHYRRVATLSSPWYGFELGLWRPIRAVS